jgi:hypothetical protein
MVTIHIVLVPLKKDATQAACAGIAERPVAAMSAMARHDLVNVCIVASYWLFYDQASTNANYYAILTSLPAIR